MSTFQIQTEYVHLLITGGGILFGKQEGRIYLDFEANEKIWFHDCLPDVHSNMWSTLLISKPCIFIAAAETPVHSETGVPKP